MRDNYFLAMLAVSLGLDDCRDCKVALESVKCVQSCGRFLEINRIFCLMSAYSAAIDEVNELCSHTEVHILR